MALAGLAWLGVEEVSASPDETPDIALATRLFTDANEAGAFLRAAEALRSKEWRRLEQFRGDINDPHALSLLDYLELDARAENSNFSQMEQFLHLHSVREHWFPSLTRLQRYAETAFAWSNPSQRHVFTYFKKYPPLTGIGMEMFGAALISQGHQREGEDLLRKAWREHAALLSWRKDFLRRYESILTANDHQARLHMLLWNEDVKPARELLSLVSPERRAIATARIRLMTRSAGVDAALRDVPADLQNDPGLVYDRARWRRRKGREDGAIELLLQAPPPKEYEKKWWVERHILARYALRHHRYQDAYDLARAHGMESGGGFADGEFLAGWLALRFLNDPESAYQHFRTLQEGVTTPISLARASYWRGRAADALSRQPSAVNVPHPYRYWSEAAEYPTTYYGQLAKELLPEGDEGNRDIRFALPQRPATSFIRRASASPEPDADFLRIVALAHSAGYKKLGNQLLLQQARQSQSSEEFISLTRAARDLNQDPVSLRIAKTAARKHIFLEDVLYPLDAFPSKALESRGRAVDPALLLAIARQESEFDSQVVSHAGARGIMQLLPTTARQVAAGANIRYSKAKLLDDPGYNIRLGELYLERMIGRFDGSYILAIAAYNAGPARVNGWLESICDPRRQSCDAIDFVERIPIEETRNYVQRVLENLQNYRRRLQQAETADIGEDLQRGGDTAQSYLPASPQR